MKSKFSFIFFVNVLLISMTSLSQTPPSKCVEFISHGPFDIALDQSKNEDGEFLVKVRDDGTTFRGKFFKNENNQSIACFYDFKRSENPKFRLQKPLYPENGCDSNVVNYLTTEQYTKACGKDSSNCWSNPDSVSIVSGVGLVFKSKKDGKLEVKREVLKQLKVGCSKDSKNSSKPAESSSAQKGLQK